MNRKIQIISLTFLGEKYFDCGHTKGGLAFDEESGFWLIHSVPKYLNPVQEGYSYPHSGCKFGQTFICLTFNTSTFDRVGLQLRFNNPHIHDSNLPEQWADIFPNMQSLIKGIESALLILRSVIVNGIYFSNRNKKLMAYWLP